MPPGRASCAAISVATKMSANNPAAKILSDNGSMRVWQYAVRRGVSGEPEQAPVKSFFLTANTAVQIEPYKPQMRVVPITEERMAEAAPLTSIVVPDTRIWPLPVVKAPDWSA